MEQESNSSQDIPFQDQGKSAHLIETVFSKLKELADGEGASKLFPQGVSSVELEVSASGENKTFRFALKGGGGVNGNTVALAATQSDGDEFGVSFNAEGHKVIALIAQIDLQANAPLVAEKVDKILKAVDRTWEEAAVFPDEIRNQQPQTKPFHFVDIPFENGGPANPPLPHPPHVLTKLKEYTEFLKSEQGNENEKGDGVSWLFHLFGDVHQPLHCIEHINEFHPAGDRGGNSFRLKGNPKNLHSAWDSSVNISEEIGNPELAEKIMELHPRNSLQNELQQADTENWARASFRIAKQHAYSIKENPENPPKLSKAYLKNMETIGRRQAALAGYRLSNRLQEIFV